MLDGCLSGLGWRLGPYPSHVAAGVPAERAPSASHQRRLLPAPYISHAAATAAPAVAAAAAAAAASTAAPAPYPTHNHAAAAQPVARGVRYY